MMRRFTALGVLLGLVLTFSSAAAVELVGGFRDYNVSLELPGIIGPMDIERALSPEGPWSLIESRPIGCTQYCQYDDYEIRPGNVFYYRVWVPHDDGIKDLYGPIRVEIPELDRIGLASLASPNPFSHRTTVSFGLPALGSASTDVRIDFIDAGGRVVRSMTKTARPGPHVVDWDGRSQNGSALPSGVYFYRIAIPGFSESGRLLLLK